MFRCPAKGCRKEISMRAHTFFHGSALSSGVILRLAHMWLANVKHTSAVMLTGHSSATVSSFYAYFRQLVTGALTAENTVIGGNNIIVEVDETKMGRRKANRGHRVQGVWIVGGVEKTPERRVFLAVVQNRNRETLVDLLSRHVSAGSIVRTDLWKGYAGIDNRLDIEHQTVNHSLFFKDPITGVNTNTIEATWRALKIRIESRSRVEKGMNERLMEFIWRRKHHADLWSGFIDALRDMHYDI